MVWLKRFGGVAQLVERLNGIQEVRGSTPLISTNSASVCYAFCKSMPIVNEWVFGKTGNKPTFGQAKQSGGGKNSREDFSSCTTGVWLSW